MATGAAIGAGVGLIGNLIGGANAAEASEEATAESRRQFQESMAMAKEAAAYLEAQGVPPAEAQKIALEQANLDPSAMEDIETDPRLRNAQMDALSRIQEVSEAGLTDSEKAEQMMAMRSVSGGAQARDKAILRSMAEQGQGGSGNELIQRLQASQSAADRGSVEQAQLQGQAQNRALQAMMQAGQLGGQIRGQEYGEQANLASAKDRIAQFNEQNRASTMNQQQIHNKGLVQQEFQNELAKRQGVAAAKTGTAQMGLQRSGDTLQAGQASAQGHIDSGAAFGNLATSLGGAYDKYNAPKKEDGGVIEYADGGTVSPYADVPTDELHRMLAEGGHKFEDGGMVPQQEEQIEQPQQQAPMSSAPNNNGGFAGGGIPIPESGMGEGDRYLEGDIVPGENYEGDRVDAKVNSGEMVINVEQQQRLMELLKGYRDLQGLGDEDIVEPTPGTADALGGLARNPEPAPQAAPPMAPPAPQFEDGGMIGEFKNDDARYSSKKAHDKPRGIHASLDSERKSEEESNVASKERKARIKAYETLIKGGK